MATSSHQLVFKKDHLYVEIEGSLWVYDTGADSSFGDRSTGLLGPKEDIAELYAGQFSAADISGFLGETVAGIIGADIINRYDHIIDLKANRLTVSDGDLTSEGFVQPLEFFMGVPMLKTNIGGASHSLFFDTGAQISYFQGTPPLEATDAGRVTQAAAQRDALSQLALDDIELVFQPILLLANPGQFGLEVLLRFRQPLLKQLNTGDLIDLAHNLGITHQIDALVIAKVGQIQAEFETSQLLRERIEYLSINISNDSVATPSRLEQLIINLRKNRIDSSRVCLEFTETPGSGTPTDPNPVSAASERLIKELNFRILIDDFGSGLSNYQRICDAWYDTIKLDIDLVSGLGDSFRMQRYLGSFIEAVHALGKTVIAEGVEDHADLAAAIRLGTDGLQGYLISRPMPWNAVETFLTESAWSSAREIEALVNKLKNSDRLLESPASGPEGPSGVPLERFILDKWYELRSFEEFLLLFVNELKRWGLDILRLSLAFLPDEDDIDCSQYVWWQTHPGDITTLRMDRAFLEQEEHLSSPLHHIARRAPFYRLRLGNQRDLSFSFLAELKEQNCSDYLGIRLDSRGISIPVLTIALRGNSSFSDEQIQRICSMSSLLSLLFYTFESERAKRLALLDPLTNLPNRRSFDSFFKALVTAARINNSKLALALMDIDRFKQVNDTMGHAYGDSCLRQVATVLDSILRRNNDIVARLGGEEFALILPDTDGHEAMRIGERLRQAVLSARVAAPDGGNGVSLTISLGIAIWDPATSSDCDVDQLLQLADDCLYEAKRQGRNRVVGRKITALNPSPAAAAEPGR
jgi:diguanylate cyclase (GGDEF)-like protein